MSDSIMMSRRFAPLFWTQALSAFNDNFLKNSLVFLILATLASGEAESLIAVAGAVLIAPFFFLSSLGGELADRYDKATVAQRLKLAEIGAAGLSAIGFAMGSIPVLMVALFCFGAVSALFGPIKYGILPDHLETRELPKANALIEGATFIAILAGTIVAGFAAGGQNALLFCILILAFAGTCWAISLAIPKTGSAAPNLVIDKNVLRSTFRLLGELYSDTRIWRVALMVSWFWLVGAIALSLMPPMVKFNLGGGEIVITTFLAVFAIAISIGSGITAWLAAGRIILLPVPVAAVLMGLFSLDLAYAVLGQTATSTADTLSAFFAGPSAVRVTIDLAGLAIAGGMFIVPSFAAVQAWADPAHRARIIAAVNVLSAAFMTVGGLALAAVQSAGVSMAAIWLVIGLANLVVAYVIFKVMPTSPLRDFISIVLRAFYRLEIVGSENLDKAGENPILAFNHVSFLDAGLALAITDKEPVFAIDHTIAQKWWVRPFVKMTRAMPLDPTRPMATRTLIKSVNAGDPLVIFPEGRLTVTGSLMKVYDGAGLIADKTNAWVVPIRIDGLEKTIFSRLTKAQVRRRWFPKVKVTILEPVKLTVDPEMFGRKRRQAAGAKLYDIMSNLVFRTTSTDKTIIARLLEAADEHGRSSLALEDPVTGSMSYRRLLTGISVLGQKFLDLGKEGDAIGVMLPNANAAPVTIFGLMSAGRVPAMLNFTAGVANVLAACKAAEIGTVLTSRAFVEKGKLDPLIDGIKDQVKIHYLEDLRETVTTGDKISGILRGGKPFSDRDPDDPAVILFTSGSEGTPKGVVLSHRNILANASQAAARIDFGRQDKVFSVLPVFHSFGMTAGLVLPLISGVPIYMYPSPLHYRIVPELVYQSGATILFGTDTFLNGYARMGHPYDFRSIRYVLAGAEPVKASTRHTYMEKFGVRILEGYGVTETAPVIAINTPMFNRTGTVGRVLPGMETRLDPVPGIDEGGRLFVRGPNVMLGYLRAENPGVLEPVEEGWHDTGDIVTIDQDGFVTIRGRAKRFAKIAGEMVSFAAVETIAAETWPNAMAAVVAVPDPRKGEKLILLTDEKDATRAAFQAAAKKKGASELMVPAEFIIQDVPVLGSGKVDFVGAAKLVKSILEESKAA